MAGLNADLSARALTLTGMAGGILFGVGAGLNGACSFSTLARLAEGHGVMLMSLLGWGFELLAMRRFLTIPQGSTSATMLPGGLVLPGLAWILWEGRRLPKLVWPQGKGVLTNGHWPLWPGVFLVAIGMTELLLMDRAWSWTSTAICASGAAEVAPCGHPATLWLVSGAAMLAMVASAVLRGSFRIRRVRGRSALRRLGAGGLMGAGASMIPGGNDGLILFGIPSFSPHSLPSWFGIVTGIWIALTIMRLLGVRVPRISCEGGVCRAEM